MKKRKRKKLGFKRTAANNWFAIKSVWQASPSYFIIHLGSSLVSGVLGFLCETDLLRRVVNGITSGADINRIIYYVILLCVISCAFQIANNWFWNIVAPKKQLIIASNIEKKLFRKAASVDLACYETPSFYDKYVRAMESAYNKILRVMWSLNMLIGKFIALFANSLLLFVIDPWLILFGLFPLLLGFLKRLDNAAAHEFEVAKKPAGRRYDYVKRTFYLGEYAKEMRVGGMYRLMLSDLRASFKEYTVLIKKYGFKRACYGYIQRIGLEVITILGATFYSVWSAMCGGGMQIGDCIVVLSSIGTISYCLSNLVQNFAEFGEHALFLEDVRYFLDYKSPIIDGKSSLPQNSGDLEIKNLYFRYSGNETDTLKDINFILHKGERIALVGSNGSGKTTLVKLLLRLYDPVSGTISWGGEDIKNFNVSDYRKSFSTVFQDFKIFSMSVRDNVLLRTYKEGDEELVKYALTESGIYEKISRYKNDIETVLTREFDNNGVNMSIGEQQMLSLARVFSDNTPFVILDEPSSALDPIAEYKMFENMMRATKDRSVVFISHRLSSAVLADRILLMENGRIIESGTHAELLNMNGKYAQMFRLQAENYLGSEVTANA